MMNFGSLIIVALANGFVVATSQYVDIFQGLQTLFQQYSTERPRHYDITTKLSTTRKHSDRLTDELYDFGLNINNFYTTVKPGKKTTSPNSSHNHHTTKKQNIQKEVPRLPWEDENLYNSKHTSNSNSKNINRNNHNLTSSNSKNVNRNNNNYSGTNVEYNRKPNNFEATTESYQKVNFLTNDNSNNNKDNDPNRITSNRNVNVSAFITTKRNEIQQRPNSFTTKSPFLRPGVKPAPVDENRPPITNKPPSQFYGQRPSDVGFVTEATDTSATIEIGPDEDDMTQAEKSRYIELAEAMCDNYKALSVKEVVALPLVPSPEGIAVNVSNCRPLNIALIIGGKVSTIEEFPHMALVGWMKTQQSGYSWKCGGSLVSDQYVLTAGHCSYHEKDYNVASGPPHAVQLGSSFVKNPNALIIKITSVIRHPKYKQRRSYHDIALLKLANRVTFSDTIRPACLGVSPPVGKPIIATGWGRTEIGGSEQSNELRSVSLPVWDMQDCRKIWGTTLKLPNGPTLDSHVCAGEKNGGKDTCQGDSGGPAQVQDGCAWRVIAVTSYGRSCGAPQTPALYARVPRAFVAAQVFGKLRNTNKYQNYESQHQNNNNYASEQQNNNGYGSQLHNNNGYESQQQNNNGYGSLQQNNNGYGSLQQNNNGYGSLQQNNNGYGSQQSSNNPTSQRYTANFYDNQQSNSDYDSQQLNVIKYNSQQQTTHRYNNYEQNSNLYQQLGNNQDGGWTNQNTADVLPIGGWPVTEQWSQRGQSNENYYGTTARPWWT